MSFCFSYPPFFLICSIVMKSAGLQTINSRAVSKFIQVTCIILCFGHCNADSNGKFSPTCIQSENCTFSDKASRDNLVSLWNSLSRIGSSHNGFYNTTAGNGSNEIYGVAQCRGDIPSAVCTNCIRDAIESVSFGCNDTKCALVYYTWCTLQYTSVDYSGYNSDYTSTVRNSSIVDNPDVATKGFNFMSELASTTPEQPLMFRYEALDLGQSVKRYGMSQCNRDLNMTACSECLNGRLEFWRTYVADKREWEIHSPRCSMWYRDYPFSYNVSRASPPSPAAPNGSTRLSLFDKSASSVIIVLLAVLIVL